MHANCSSSSTASVRDATSSSGPFSESSASVSFPASLLLRLDVRDPEKKSLSRFDNRFWRIQPTGQLSRFFCQLCPAIFDPVNIRQINSNSTSCNIKKILGMCNQPVCHILNNGVQIDKLGSGRAAFFFQKARRILVRRVSFRGSGLGRLEFVCGITDPDKAVK